MLQIQEIPKVWYLNWRARIPIFFCKTRFDTVYLSENYVAKSIYFVLLVIIAIMFYVKQNNFWTNLVKERKLNTPTFLKLN